MQDIPWSIVVVDDDPILIQLIKSFINSSSPRSLVVETFTDPNLALAFIEENHVDLLFCDLNMPGMDGLDLIAKASKLKPHIQSTLMSGDGSERTRRKAFQIGCHGFLDKPFKASEITVILNICCNNANYWRRRLRLSKVLATA